MQELVTYALQQRKNSNGWDASKIWEDTPVESSTEYLYNTEEEKRAIEKAWDESPNMFNAQYIEGGLNKSLYNIFKEAAENDVPIATQGTIEDIDRLDNETNYKHTKKLIHDISYFDSTEKAIVDSIKRREWEQEYSKVLDRNQAHELSKQLGSEIKFDKDVTEGRVRYEVNQRLKKKSLEEELAYWQETGDYTAKQNLLLGWSAISGSYGALNLAFDIGVSMLGGAGVSLALAKWANTIGKATKLATGIRAAQTSVLASKRANALRKAGKDMMQISQYARKEQEALALARLENSFSTNLGYDIYRFGKQAMGQHASLTSTIIPFSIDAAVTTAIDSSAKLAIRESDEYNVANMLSDILTAGTFGVFMPVIPAIGKNIVPLAGKVLEGASNTVGRIFNKASAEEAMKGHIGRAEVINTTKDEILNTNAEVMNIINSNSRRTEEVLEGADALAKMNLTNEELHTALYKCVKAIKGEGGSIKEALDPETIRSSYLTKIPDIRNFFTEIAEKDIDEETFIALLKERGIDLDIVKNGDLSIQELETFLVDPSKYATVKFSKETGALGKYAVKGLNKTEALTFLKNLYISKLLSDTGIGRNAYKEAVLYLEKLKNIKQYVDRTIKTYDYIAETNKQVGIQIPYKAQLVSYDVLKGVETTAGEQNKGSLANAIYDIIELCFPEDYKEYNLKNLQKWKEIKEEELIKGRKSISEQDFEILDYALDNISEFKYDLYKKLTDIKRVKREIRVNGKKTYEILEYVNLKPKEGSKEHTGRLKDLSNNLNKMIEENTALLETELNDIEEVLEQSGDNTKLEEILEKLNRGEDVPESGITFESNKLDNVQMNNLLKDNNEHTSRLVKSKAELASLESTPAHKNFLNTLERMTKATNNKIRVALNYFQQNQQDIVNIENLLKKDLTDIKNNILTNLIDNKRLINRVKEKPLFVPELRKILRTELLNVIEKELPGVQINKTLNKALNDSLNNIDDILKDFDSTKFKTLIKDSTAVVEDTAEEIADKVANAESQRVFISKIVDPLLSEVAVNLTDLQNAAIHTQVNAIRIFDRVIENPSMIPETLLSELTTSWANIKEGSLSIEGLSNVIVDKINIEKALQEASEKGENLREYVANTDNKLDIMKAVLLKIKKDANQLSKEEIANFKENSSASRVATILLNKFANYRDLYFTLGSNKNNLVDLLNPTKLRKMQNWIPEQVVENSEGMKAVSFYDFMEKFATPIDNSNESIGLRNLAVFLFEHLDLEATFNPGKDLSFSLNTFRDALLQRQDIITLTTTFKKQGIQDAIKIIQEGILGNSNKLGLIGKLRIGSNNAYGNMISQSAKYMEDVDPKLIFKSIDSEMEAISYLGYDDINSWLDTNLGNVKRGYYLLNKSSSEPIQFYNGIKEMVREYVNNDLSSNVNNLTKKQIAKMTTLKKHIEQGGFWDRQFEYCLNQLCGNYSLPATGMLLWAKLATRVISSPMLMKAGLKSVTDYENQFQYLVTMGLNTGKDINARAKTLGGITRIISRDKHINEALFMTNLLKTNAISEALLGESTVLSKEIVTVKDAAKFAIKGVGKVNKYASIEDKASQWVQFYSDLLTNKMALIKPLTDYNRTNAGLNVMRAIGNFKDVKYDDFPTVLKSRLQATLNRYGITKAEWDDILSTHCCMSVKDYLEKTNGKISSDMFSNHMMFFADNIVSLDDNILKRVMLKNAKANNQTLVDISKEAIQRYRQYLVDKATLLVHTSADEMTAIPTVRIQAIMHGGYDPNTLAGTIAGIATQFQSFGMASWLYHFGRRYATHIDPDNPIANHLLLNSTGFGNMAKDMFGMLTEMALFQYIVNETLNWLVGNRQEDTDIYGDIDKKVLFGKIGKAYADQFGIAGTVLDTVYSGITNPRGVGGGLSIPVAPALSSLISSGQKIINVASKSSNEGRRGQAAAGQTIQELLKYTGIPTHPFLQAVWGCTIGDWLDEISRGPSYYDYKDMRYRRGYRKNWAGTLLKDGDIY